MSIFDKTGRSGAALLVTTVAATATMAGCATTDNALTPSAQQSMTLFVAANATDPVNDLIQKFNHTYPNVKISPNYAGTQILETQLEQGANADFFLSADLAHMQKIKDEGLIDRFQMVSQTRPVLIVPKSNPAGIRSMQDLGTKPVKLLIGVDSVPVGKYARQIFEKANGTYGSHFSSNTMSHVVSFETNVKQIVQKVALGEADAGVVYLTDVTSDLKDKVTIVEIPKEFNVTATNYIAVPKKAPHPSLGNDFMKLMLSSEGQDVFKQYGYNAGE